MEYPLNQAMQSTLAVLTKVRPDDLDAPTPCASWDVRALVNHFVGTARWWAATMTGDGEVADTDYAAGDFVAAYEESIAIAVGAFAADGALERTVRLPFGEFPGTVVLGMAALDQFTHGWDLARAIGHPTDLDPRAGLRTARPGQARDHRRVSRARRPGSVRARRGGSRPCGAGRPAGRLPRPLGVSRAR